MNSMNTVIYPGTFDPITYGHLNLITRASVLFSTVVVAVAPSRHKQTLFATEQRTAMCRSAIEAMDLHNVSVQTFTGLLVNFAKAQRCSCILRGVRTMFDFDYEYQMAAMNHEMFETLETIFLPAVPAYRHISGTMVRDIIRLNGDIRSFVPEAVLSFVERYHGVENN